MPLTPQFTWEEDVSSVALHVPMKGASRKDVDIYVADLVVKINFKPYVLVVDLHAPIEPENTTVTITNGVIVLVAQKHERGGWKQLGYEGSKADRLKRRQESMARKEAYEQKLSEDRKDLKYQSEKKTLRDQMSLDELERQRLDDLKADEKQREEDAMYKTFRDIQPPSQAQRKKAPSVESSKAPPAPPAPVELPILEMTANGEFDIPLLVQDDALDAAWQSSDTESEPDEHDNNADRPDEAATNNPAEDDADVVYLPPPRQNDQVNKIAFTPRVFPTPSRESTAVDEENWLLKNRKHLKSHKGLHAGAAAQDISESDPVWLKAKGDDFYRHKDFRSAINAYGEALAIDPSLTPCLSNRAACFLQVGEYHLCADDCSKALALLPDRGDAPTMHTIQLKVRVLVRRGTAYCQLGLYSQAKADYGVALTYHPQNDALQLDFARIGQLEACAEWKRQGDESYKCQDFAAARDMYSQALNVDPTFISCLSNRAACHLALLNAQSCISDCSRALAILEDTVPTAVPYSAIPAPGSAKRRQWVLKTLVRRGTAYTMEKAWAKAEQDYVDGLSLDPDNAQLADDLAHVRRTKRGSP